ncbi:MAG: hypothetical protein AWT59_2237 [Candidatus Gallionella acididurans]|uniref:Lipoprotein n=1 Tax=Candidatus Gallionella acididurans TaxID=1796491 RepID=A0A139BRK9_9PROT|nr:MAG: hypothetical protein AWT59_2237 [Candidatus Gallionella acididurans]
MAKRRNSKRDNSLAIVLMDLPWQVNIQSLTRSKILAMPMVGLIVMTLLSGCAVTTQSYPTTLVQSVNLEPQALKTGGIAFITPGTVTGQEEDKQNLALAFTDALKQARPDLRIVTLPETLGIINRDGLAEEYKKMYEDSRLTGIFNRDTLRKISRQAGARYIAQLQLGGFTQSTQGLWGFLGFNMSITEITTVRLFLQIWDGENGTIVWEGSQELTLSSNQIKQSPVSFKDTVELSAQELIARLYPIPAQPLVQTTPQ